MNLTDNDRELIARARELGPKLRARTGDADRLAGWLLAELADLAERLAKVPDSQISRAVEIAKAMTADDRKNADAREWTAQDVLNIAPRRGLAALERTYVKSDGACAACGHSRTEHLTRSPSRPEPYFCAQCNCRQYRDGGQAVTG